MSKQKTRTIIKPVGVAQPKAYSFCKEQSSNRASIQGDPHFEEIAKNNKGITLIALIITIIVMLILLGVSVTVALNGGLFSTAQKATADTELEKDKELALSDGTIEINGKKYLSIEDYRAGIERAPDIMGGKGTETNPYTIDSIEALVQFAYSVTNGKTYEGEYVKLTRNLDFKSTDSYIDATRTDYEEYGYTGELMAALTTGEGFKPIGNGDEGKGNIFAGIFDGNAKVISNLRINKEDNIVSDIGLFSDNLGEIKNLGIKDCDINITPSESSAIAANYGAICGYNYGEIKNCWASGSIESIHNVDKALRIGGIVGATNSSSTEISISNCYNKININVLNNTGKTTLIGGIIGGRTNTIINNCYNVGNIAVEHIGTTRPYIGGLIGGGTGTSSRCYNLGQVNGKYISGEPLVGGVAGLALNVDYCCNIGTVTYEGTSANRVGTLLGACEGTLSNSYSLTNAELNGIGRNYSGTSEPTKYDTIAEMPTVLEIVGDAFKEDTNNINDGYPILTWQ